MIGNLVPAGMVSLPRHLITPHGDREPSLFRVSYTLDASETTPNTAVDLPICAWTPVWR